MEKRRFVFIWHLQERERLNSPEKREIFRHRTSRTINYRLRFLVMRRDNFKCCVTGRSPATDPNVILEVDHIVPWDKGGETVLENLQTLTKEINIGKSNLDMTQPAAT
jgi:5-methylcytosine-specific restriction endonuclease McrA